ncbi:thrombopoietin receptor [Discoglossus pictus]
MTVEDQHGVQQFFYKYGRGPEWQQCEDTNNRTGCLCVFMARNDSAVSVKVDVSSHSNTRKIYYKETFLMHHIVRPLTPKMTVEQLSGGRLALQWVVPFPELEQDMEYQIRFSQNDNVSWKTLKVPGGVLSEVLDLVPGSHYTLQMRAGPSGERVQGSWSEWSPPISIQIPASRGWITILVVLSLLLVPGSVLCLFCIFPSVCRKLKDKLWPPLPNLHRVLDSFLTEMQKQYKPSPTLYEKPMEEAPQSFTLEILSEEGLSTETQPISQDYVQLSPPMYQNEEYWPKPGVIMLKPSPSSVSVNQPVNGIINQSYLRTGWDKDISMQLLG